MVATIDRTESSYLLYVGLVERSRVSSTKYIENLMLSVLAIDSATTCYNKAYRSKHNLFSQHSTFQQTLHSNIVNHGMLLHAPPKRISQYITSQRKLSGMHAAPMHDLRQFLTYTCLPLLNHCATGVLSVGNQLEAKTSQFGADVILRLRVATMYYVQNNEIILAGSLLQDMQASCWIMARGTFLFTPDKCKTLTIPSSAHFCFSHNPSLTTSRQS